MSHYVIVSVKQSEISAWLRVGDWRTEERENILDIGIVIGRIFDIRFLFCTLCNCQRVSSLYHDGGSRFCH